MKSLTENPGKWGKVSVFAGAVSIIAPQTVWITMAIMFGLISFYYSKKQNDKSGVKLGLIGCSLGILAIFFGLLFRF